MEQKWVWVAGCLIINRQDSYPSHWFLFLFFSLIFLFEKRMTNVCLFTLKTNTFTFPSNFVLWLVCFPTAVNHAKVIDAVLILDWGRKRRGGAERRGGYMLRKETDRQRQWGLIGCGVIFSLCHYRHNVSAGAGWAGRSAYGAQRAAPLCLHHVLSKVYYYRRGGINS